MPYIVSPTDATTPQNNQGAAQGAEEFRALKAYLQTLTISAGKSLGATRQTILFGPTDANGLPNFLAAGTGLTVDLTTAARATIMAFAVGYNPTIGSIDRYSQLTNDANGVTNLLPSNTSYITADYSTVDSVVWNNYLVPSQYGFIFDRTQGALLNFEGIDASTTFLDDFGNTWTGIGNAQIDTAQFKFGTSSLLLDGTGDAIKCTNITTLGASSWEISTWVRWNSLPGAAARQNIFSFAQAASIFGVNLWLFNNAGTIRLEISLSSNGTSHDIASGTTGTNTVWAANTWYKVRLVFDALGGTYRVYLSIAGAAETQDISVASAVKICGIAEASIGADTVDANGINGWIDAFRFIRCATTTAIETPSASAPQITDFPYHWFSISEMRMYEITGVSSAAGSNPLMTIKERLFVAEADTSGAAVTAVRNYAYRGLYRASAAWPAVGTAVNLSHNIGVSPEFIAPLLRAICKTADGGFTPGDIMPGVTQTSTAESSNVYTRSSVSGGFTTGNTSALILLNRTTGVGAVAVAANWNYLFTAQRIF